MSDNNDNIIKQQIKPRETETQINNEDINELKNQPGIISSPMVGTIYLSPEPGTAPFIKIGQNVNIGDTLFIIEAMKTMNHVPSTSSGTVKKILVQDGEAVEFGQTLVLLK